MSASFTSTMPVIWFCILLLLSLVQGHPTSSFSGFSGFPAFSDSGTPKRDYNSFSVGLTRNPNFNPNGHQQRLRALAKWGSGIPEVEDYISLKGSIGDVDAYTQAGDREWLSPFSIGTPPQSVLLDFDTGSSDLWVFSSETKTTGAKNGSRQIWHPELSSSASKMNTSRWQISYGDGSYATGYVWQDTVSMGGLTIPNAIVESAVQVSRSMVTDVSLSGLLGLAYKQPSEVEPPAPTFLDMLLPTLDAPVFTVDLHWHDKGLYEFGKIDDAKYNGNLSWQPLINGSKFWETTFQGFNVGPGDQWLVSTWKTIIDTGTTLMLMPDDLVALYYQNVTGAAYDPIMDAYLYPCNTSLPDLHIGWSNDWYYATIPGKFMNYTDMLDMNDSVNCYGGIQPVSGLPFSIFGDVFLKALYAVFDQGNSRVGFGDKSA